MKSQYVEGSDLRKNPEFTRALFFMHAAMASNHRLADIHTNPGIQCSGKGADLPGWAHWATGWVISSLQEIDFLHMRKKFGIYGASGKSVLILGNGTMPFPALLTRWGMLVCAVDSDPVEEVGANRHNPPKHRKFVIRHGSPLPFSSEHFDLCLAFSDKTHVRSQLSDVARVLKPGALVMAVLDVEWGWGREDCLSLASDLNLAVPESTEVLSTGGAHYHQHMQWQKRDMPDYEGFKYGLVMKK